MSTITASSASATPKKRRGNISAEQKTELINFMENHSELRSGKFTKNFTFKKSQELWAEITNVLNSLPGAKKSWQQWRKTWADLKGFAKKKKGDIKRYRVTTGGGAELPKDRILTTDEEKVVDMLCSVATEGIDVPEPSFTFDLEPAMYSVVDESGMAMEHETDPALTTDESDHDYFYKIDNEENDPIIIPEEIHKDNSVGKDILESVGGKKKATKKLFQVTRLNNSIAATEKLSEQNERRITQKQIYESKKLKLYQEDILVKSRIATALEAIVKKL